MLVQVYVFHFSYFLDLDFNEAQNSGFGGGGILQGVVICVAKSLSNRQVELNELVKQLGGDFRWNFDEKASVLMLE